MKYACSFPDCPYETNQRSKIDFHHIVPREIDPKSRITVPLCKTHHAMIYVRESVAGQHSIATEGSLIIHNIFQGTHESGILYETMEGKRFYWLPKSKELWND